MAAGSLLVSSRGAAAADNGSAPTMDMPNVPIHKISALVVLCGHLTVLASRPSLPAHPSCWPPEKLGSSRQPLPAGVVNVVERFGADATGASDSTTALRSALIHARTHNVTLFVPLGCYQVTDTLVVTEPRNGRWQPTQIVGERPHGSLQRPAFVLPPQTPGFTDKSKYKPMFTFWTNWCLSPGADESQYFHNEYYHDQVWCGKQHSMPGWMFNMLVQDVNFVVGSGNLGAVAIDMMGAQGSTLQDITIYAATDAFAGLAGGNGGGGMFVGITVYGARYGIDARHPSIAATYAVITLINQSCAGMIVGRRH